MGNRWGIAVACLTIAGVVAGVDAAGASPSPAAAHSQPHGERASATCILPATAGSTGRGVAKADASSHRSHGTGGDVTVTIPAAVFIRSEGGRLVVTTNTGQRPQPRDTFYLTAHGHTAPASSSLRRAVISGCTELR